METVSLRIVSALAVITSRYAVVIRAGEVAGTLFTGDDIGTALPAVSFLQEDTPEDNIRSKSSFIFILP